MTTEAERAAEECSQKWAITAIKEVGQPLYALSSDVIKDIKHRLKHVFLAGHAAALTPRRIILGQPDTYPQFNADVLFYKAKSTRWNIFFIKDEKDLREWFSAGYTNYLPLPPTPQREGE